VNHWYGFDPSKTGVNKVGFQNFRSYNSITNALDFFVSLVKSRHHLAVYKNHL